MVLRVIGLLLLVPLADMLLLVVLATRLGPVTLGAVPTVAIVVLTAFVGLLLARAEGRHTLRKLRQKAASGEPPTDELFDGGLLLVAGALMLTPGLATDLIGFLLVLPPTRYPIRLGLKRYVVTPYVDEKTGGFATGNAYVAGFPGQNDAGSNGGPFSAGGSGEGFPGGDNGGETVEVGDDAYEFTDVGADRESTDTADGEDPPRE